jgi:hypothetical protein
VSTQRARHLIQNVFELPSNCFMQLVNRDGVCIEYSAARNGDCFTLEVVDGGENQDI